MDNTLKTALNYANSISDSTIKKLLYDLISLVEYYQERDRASDAKLDVCRKLNANYRDHLIKLIRDNEEIDSKLQTLSDTNFGSL